VINQNGSLVWNGEMTITGPRNRPIVTAIPLNDMLRDKKPGVYLAVVERTDTKDDGRSTPATNWVLVSNLGLTTYSGTDGMAVAVEVAKRQLTSDTLGAHDITYALARDARIGTWHAELKLDSKAPAIGSIEFRVEDFVPPQLKVELSAADRPVKPGEPFPVTVGARYYYGAPGAGLSVEAQASIAFDDAPFPNEPGFHFGLVGDEFTSTRNDLEPPAT